MDQFPQFECEDGKQTWYSSETTGPSVREALFVLFGLDGQAKEGCYSHPLSCTALGRGCHSHQVLTKLNREFLQKNYRFGLCKWCPLELCYRALPL